MDIISRGGSRVRKMFLTGTPSRTRETFFFFWHRLATAQFMRHLTAAGNDSQANDDRQVGVDASVLDLTAEH